MFSGRSTFPVELAENLNVKQVYSAYNCLIKKSGVFLIILLDFLKLGLTKSSNYQNNENYLYSFNFIARRDMNQFLQHD